MAREYQLEQAAKTAGQAVDGLSRLMPVVERFVSALEKATPSAESAIKSVGRAADALDRALPAVERSLAVVEKTASLIATEREATIKALSAELTRAIAFIQEERLATLKQLTTERIAAVRDVGEAVAQERRLLSQEIDGIAMKAVDRAFLRAAQLWAASLVAVFVGVIVLMIVAKRVFVGSRGTGS